MEAMNLGLRLQKIRENAGYRIIEDYIGDYCKDPCLPSLLTRGKERS